MPPFLDPFGAVPSAEPSLAAFLQQAASDLSHWLATAGASSPLPPSLPALDAAPPQHGIPPHRLLADLQQVMEGAYNPSHPGALAHLDPPPLTAAIAAEMVCAGLNNNLLAEELSPGLSRLERDLCRWLARSLGMPAGSGGVPASGGSLSNLIALVTARQRRGLAGRPDAVVLCSADAHVSLDKAVMVMGLPPEALVRLPLDAMGRLEIGRLADALAALDRRGTPVIAVVATAGTTVRGAIDPLAELADLCHARGQWLHVDGAIGAVFALGSHVPSGLEALGRADSLTVNPQKLLGIPKTSSLLLLAEPQALAGTFGTGLPYMEPPDDGEHGGEAGLQGTRPAEILKLWLGLRQLGLAGIDGLLQGALGRCRTLEQLLEPAAEHLQCCGGPLHLLAFTPATGDGEAAERWSQRTRGVLLASGLMLSRPLHHGRRHLKAVLGNPHTRPEDLERLAAIVIDSLPS
ncbi:MAG: pyridoxal phosphate-dependent decarboxylase family protein [Synechococcaceae cyanobacterium]